MIRTLEYLHTTGPWHNKEYYKQQALFTAHRRKLQQLRLSDEAFIAAELKFKKDNQNG